MNLYEAVRQAVLKKAALRSSSNEAAHIRASVLSFEYGIPESQVRDQLVLLKEAQLISLAAWDGERERPYDEWPDADSFFLNRSDAEHARIRLLSAGGELLSELPKAPIGFAPTRVAKRLCGL